MRHSFQRSALPALVFCCAAAMAACGGDTSGTGKGDGTANSGNQNAGTNSANGSINAQTGGGGRIEDPICDNGTCMCADTLVLCDDICVDLSQNTNHCGECGQECGTGGICVSGNCQCGDGALQCDGECVDPSSDVDNCGECGRDCDRGESCISGQCQALECADGEVACDGECVAVASDPNNCGRCGVTCFDGEVCTSGQCTCDDPSGPCGDVGNDGRVVGGACEQDQNLCAEGSTCAMGDNFRGGTCTTECQANSDCPDQTACVDIDGGTCLLRCDADGTCRDGYECRGRDAVRGDEVRVCIAD